MFRFRSLRRFLLRLALRPFSRSHRQRIGRGILDWALCENNCRPDKNGEYHFLNSLFAGLGSREFTVFDVGAHVGGWTLAVCEKAPPQVTAFCFEPCDGSFEALKRNVDGQQHERSIRVVHAAVGDFDGTARLAVSEEKPYLNSLVSRDDLRDTDTAVSVVRGDTFCRDNGIERVGLLKIDTEGNELKVLRGFEGMLAEGRVDLVQFEYNWTWLHARCFLAEAFEFLAPKGYVLGKLFPRGVEFFEAYRRDLDSFQYANYVAVRPEWTGLFRRVR